MATGEDAVLASGSWVGASAVQLARAVQRGDATATEVVADHLDHARVADRVVDALRVLRDSEAIAEAEQVEQLPDLAHLPLAGVPVVVKENTPVAGLPTWNGSAAARAAVAEQDHEVVRRLRGAGAIVLGITRMPELGLWSTTDDASAVTRNPWRSDLTAGGSSGGAAAAVAAGVVPLAQGNDGLGSIRIPAACCGLVGFKPGHGVIAYDLGVSDWFGLAEHGVLATTVADAAVGFAVLAGRDPAPLPELGRVRVAVSLRSPVLGVWPDQDARISLAAAARDLARAGHNLVRADPVYPWRLSVTGIATWVGAAATEAEAADQPNLQPRSRGCVTVGSWALRRGLVRAGERADWRQRCVSWFADRHLDVLLLPALAASPPPAVPAWSTRSWLANVATGIRMAAYFAPWNLAGLPAMVVPMGLRRSGVPGAVQLVGPPGSELTLLAIAEQLAQAAPWRPYAPSWPRVAAARSGRVHGGAVHWPAGAHRPR
ncbi:MAG TPA: amidase family protein [Micromonosporaceae bacterium]